MKSKLMTKLALAAAVACAAVGEAQAKSIDLKISDVLPTGKANSYSAYYFVSSDGNTGTDSLYKGATIEKVLNVIAGYDTSTTLNKLAFGYKTYVNYNAGGMSFNVSNSTTLPGTYTSDALSFFAIIFDKGTDPTGKSDFNYLIAKTSDGSAYKTGVFTSSQSNLTLDWGSQSSNTQWMSVASIIPEPTSGVLLLVGVAALALRRKKAV